MGRGGNLVGPAQWDVQRQLVIGRCGPGVGGGEQEAEAGCCCGVGGIRG